MIERRRNEHRKTRAPGLLEKARASRKGFAGFPRTNGASWRVPRAPKLSIPVHAKVAENESGDILPGRAKAEIDQSCVSGSTGDLGSICTLSFHPRRVGPWRIYSAQVVDRTQLILDIFGSARAAGRVDAMELAPWQYLFAADSPGCWHHCPGRRAGWHAWPGRTTQLDVDRRRVQERIARLSASSKRCARHAQLSAKVARDINGPVAAVVGYTNAGKSTLLNLPHWRGCRLPKTNFLRA